MNFRNISAAFMIALSAFFLAGCHEQQDELTAGTNYVLKSQQEVESFQVKDDIGTLTISGEGITDLSMLSVQHARQLIIENTDIQQLEISSLNAITGALRIKGNEKLEAIDGLKNLYFVNGTITISDNPELKDISGLLNLKVFKGSLSISGNASLGENLPCASHDQGFCVLKYLMESGVVDGTILLSNNAPGSVNDPALIGQTPGSDIISYTLASASDIENFNPLSDTVQDLRISGSGITDQLLGSLSSKIVWAKGTVTIENTNISNTEGFFDRVYCDGDIILRNNLNLTNPNGFKNYKKINGDLIIENCPNLFYWASADATAGFSGIERVEGSLRINPATSMDSGGGGLGKLTYVGGTLEITGDKTKGEIWNLDTWHAWSGGIKYIGEDLIYKNHYKVNGLSGFQSLEHLGGDVYILDNGGPDGVIPMNSTQNQVGFCLIRQWLDNGVVKKEEPTIELRQSPGEGLIDINTLVACQP